MQASRLSLLLVVVCGGLSVSPVRAERRPIERAARVAATLDMVDAVNALAPSDIGVAAAARTGCSLDRLPRSRDDLLSLVPGDHQRLLADCARGRIRIVRGVKDFDLVGMIDDPAERPAAVAAVRAFFAERPVDVATGVGVSDGPYPIRFDWVVVLDARSRTMVSVVINCRD